MYFLRARAKMSRFYVKNLYDIFYRFCTSNKENYNCCNLDELKKYRNDFYSIKSIDNLKNFENTTVAVICPGISNIGALTSNDKYNYGGEQGFFARITRNSQETKNPCYTNAYNIDRIVLENNKVTRENCILEKKLTTVSDADIKSWGQMHSTDGTGLLIRKISQKENNFLIRSFKEHKCHFMSDVSLTDAQPPTTDDYSNKGLKKCEENYRIYNEERGHVNFDHGIESLQNNRVVVKISYDNKQQLALEKAKCDAHKALQSNKPYNLLNVLIKAQEYKIMEGLNIPGLLRTAHKQHNSTNGVLNKLYTKYTSWNNYEDIIYYLGIAENLLLN